MNKRERFDLFLETSRSFLSLKEGIEAGVDPNLYDDETTKRTLLHEFARQGDYQSVNFLLAKGANPEILDFNDHTSFCLAAHMNHKEIFELLVNKTFAPYLSGSSEENRKYFEDTKEYILYSMDNLRDDDSDSVDIDDDRTPDEIKKDIFETAINLNNLFIDLKNQSLESGGGYGAAASPSGGAGGPGGARLDAGFESSKPR
jgi:ankyrin repeat protein